FLVVTDFFTCGLCEFLRQHIEGIWRGRKFPPIQLRKLCNLMHVYRFVTSLLLVETYEPLSLLTFGTHGSSLKTNRGNITPAIYHCSGCDYRSNFHKMLAEAIIAAYAAL